MMQIIKALPAVLVLVVSVAVAGLAAEAQLIVQVSTDQMVYQAGDEVTVEVRTFFNGELTSAKITSAVLSVTLPSGKVVKSEMAKDFEMVSPGVYVATGLAKAPGSRELEVKAKLKVGCKCNAKVLHSQGFVNYDVEVTPLTVGIQTDQLAPSVCDTVEVTVSLSRRATVQLLAVFENGAHRHLVLPGKLDAGDHTIRFSLKSFFDVGLVTIKVIASDGYGQKDVGSVVLDVAYGVCDC